MTTPTQGRFHSWFNAGFASDIISVTKPGCALSPKSEIKPADCGKAPGRYSAATGMWSSWNWRAHITTLTDCDIWEASGANIGLRSKRFPGLDLDIDDPTFADMVETIADQILGAAPVRRRLGSGRRLLMYRSDAPIRKISLAWERDGVKEKIELLGDGQQYVVDGLHPAGSRYGWAPLQPAQIAATLRPITVETLARFFAEIEALVELWGGTLVRGGTSISAMAGARHRIGSDALAAPDLGELAAAVEAIPNEQLDYDQWVTLTAAIKAAARGDEDFFIDTYLPWSLRWPENDVEAVRKRWDSIFEAEIGADYLFARARAHGWHGAGGAAGDFTAVAVPAGSGPAGSGPAGSSRSTGAAPRAGAVGAGKPQSDGATPPEPKAPKQEIPESWIERHAYVLTIERYVDLENMQMLSESAFKRAYCHYGHPSSDKENAAMLWQLHPAARKPMGLTYRPGAPMFVTEAGRSDAGLDCLNTWRPSGLLPALGAVESDVQPWLDHLRYLIPDDTQRDIFISWLAWLLQHPEQKPNWAVLFGSPLEGVGKDLAVQPVLRALGEHNWKIVSQSEVDSPYTGWAAQSQLVVIEEVKNFSSATLNRMKAYITVPPEKVSVNIKNVAHFEVPNQAAFLAYTNYEDALQIQRGDRRWFVLWSEAKPRDAKYYERFAAWIETHSGAIAGWLLSRDLAAFDATGRAPMTEAKEEMRQAALPAFETWLEHAISDGVKPFDTDLVVIEDAMAKLPRHVTVLRPSDKAVGRVLRHLGALKLGKIRLGGEVGTTGVSRPNVWAIRRGDMYADLTEGKIAELFWKQHHGSAARDFTPVGSAGS